MTQPEALAAMGLPADATEAAIRRRFQELAMVAHPDQGGTPEQFARLHAVYRTARSIPITKQQAKKLIRRDTVADLLEISVSVAKVLEKPGAAAFLRHILTNLQQKG